MKKLLLLLMALLVCACCALAEETTYKADGYRYALQSDGTAKIVRVTRNKEVLELPTELDGHPVTALAAGCFEFISKHVQITIPDCITVLEQNPFSACSKLEALIVSPTHPTLRTVDGVLYTADGARLICHPRSAQRTGYNVLEGTQVIGHGAFFNCEQLVDVVLPQGVTTLERDAFFSCDAMESILLPEGIESIGVEAFFYCVSLREVVLPSTLRTLGEAAFSSCRSMERLVIPAGLAEIPERAFGVCSALREVVIPEGVTSIGAKAFVEGRILAEVQLPASLASIGPDAFKDCPASFAAPEGSWAAAWVEAHALPLAGQ